MGVLPQSKLSTPTRQDAVGKENNVLEKVNILMMAIGQAILVYPSIAQYCLNILAVIALYLIFLRN